MNYGSDDGLVRRLGVFAITAAVLSVVIGLSAMTGWTLHIQALLTWGAAKATTPNSAACMILAGLSLLLQRQRDNRPLPPASRLTAKASAALVALIGLLTLGDTLFRLNLGIDRTLLRLHHGPPIVPAHISPLAAGAFLVLGVALLGIDWRTRGEHWPAQYLCLVPGIAIVFGLLGLLLGPSVSPVFLALPTVVALAALTAGLLCSRPNWAMGGLLIRRSPGARLLRSALPGALLVLGLLGSLITKPLLSGGQFTWVEVSALAIVTGGLVTGFVGWIAFVVDRYGEREKPGEGSQLGQIHPDRVLDGIEEPERDARLRWWIRAPAAVAVLLTVLLIFLSWRDAQETTETAEWVARTQEMMTDLESALRHSLDVETGGRGFAETGSAKFLEPYESGRPAVVQDLHALRLLVTTPDQLQRLNVLEEQTNDQVKDVEAIVAKRRNTGEVPNLALFEQGKHDTDAVRITVEQMEAAERALLALRTQRVRGAQHSSRVVIALGALLGMIFLSFAAMTVSQEIGVRAKAQAQIKAVNASLEHRVEQRTAALMESEAKLGASEQMFRTLLDGVEDYAVYMLDREGRVVSWNSGAVRIHGYHAEEIIGKHVSCFHLATEVGRNRPWEGLEEAEKNGHFEEQGWRLHKDGSTFWANVVITPLHDGNGGLSGFSKVVRDITSQKQAGDKLKSHAALLDQASDAILVRDLESRVTFLNRAAQRMYGLSAERASGRVSPELLQPEFPLPLAAIEVALAAKGEWQGELRHRNSQRGEVVVASRWTLQRDEQGAPAAILEINRDVTEQKQAEVMRDRLAAIVEYSDDAIISEDLNGLVTAWNRGAEKVYGYSAPEVLGQSSSLFIPPERKDEEVDILRRIALGGSVEHLETIRMRKDGVRIDVSATVAPIRSDASEIVGASYVIRDITERKGVEAEREKVAAELARYTRALERSNLELDAFAYAASHDLKAPLRVIYNASTWIEEDLAENLTDQIGENMILLRGRVRRMDRLLDDLLEYSRIGRDTEDRPAQVISGAALMENILGLLAPPEGFIVEATSGFDGIVIFRMPLQQILINLISNSIKHHDKKTGHIEVSVEDLGAMFRFRVKDDGPGIPAKYHEQVFRMFQTLKPRDQVEGSGMGLAMVRKYIDVAGGELDLESAVGQGSTFSFTWPKQDTKFKTKQIASQELHKHDDMAHK
jgi:PAS domain S-box-containing protein